jgi:hypothetical protein
MVALAGNAPPIAHVRIRRVELQPSGNGAEGDSLPLNSYLLGVPFESFRRRRSIKTLPTYLAVIEGNANPVSAMLPFPN